MTDWGTADINGTEVVTDLTPAGSLQYYTGVVLSSHEPGQTSHSPQTHLTQSDLTCNRAALLESTLGAGQGGDSEEEEGMSWKAGCAEE